MVGEGAAGSGRVPEDLVHAVTGQARDWTPTLPKLAYEVETSNILVEFWVTVYSPVHEVR